MSLIERAVVCPSSRTQTGSGRAGRANSGLALGERGQREAQPNSRNWPDDGERVSGHPRSAMPGSLPAGGNWWLGWDSFLASIPAGENPRCSAITKRGDSYLRTLLIHGARAVIRGAERKAHDARGWLANLVRRRSKNVAAVALVNKNARVV